MLRCVLHMDLDAFFASVEALDDPSLVGRPVLVGYDGSRGVVCTASYEARRFGCHSAQPMAMARRLCPEAVIRPPRFDRYQQLSAVVMDTLASVSPVMEPLSLDEAFVELTGVQTWMGRWAEAGAWIRREVRSATGLACSIGIGPNKSLAKLACEMAKPDGLKLIEPQQARVILDPLPVGRLWGVGPATADKLESLGIRTIGQLRSRPVSWLESIVGRQASGMWALAHGLDDRPVEDHRKAKSIGQERTFGQDVCDSAALRGILLWLTESVCRSLRGRELLAGTMTLKLRTSEFVTISRSVTLTAPTDSTQRIWEAADGLLGQWLMAGMRPLRLAGITLSKLVPRQAAPGMLFEHPEDEKQRRLDETMDAVRRKFGDRGIRRAGSME
ncbi:MAG: DNA polymerase IV [Phycisphaeraceae bacterium]|nr:DNA polymerase IV [Phycisphaeraceae bacterium]